MAVRGKEGFLDRQTDHLLAAAHDARGTAPVLKERARALDVAAFHRELDVGEVVAELPEAEREIEHRDVEEQREERMHGAQQVVREQGQEHRRHDGHQPGDDAVAALAAVERLLEPARPGGERAVHRLSLAERPPLLDDERGDDRESAHAAILR